METKIVAIQEKIKTRPSRFYSPELKKEILEICEQLHEQGWTRKQVQNVLGVGYQSIEGLGHPLQVLQKYSVFSMLVFEFIIPVYFAARRGTRPRPTIFTARHKATPYDFYGEAQGHALRFFTARHKATPRLGDLSDEAVRDVGMRLDLSQ